MQFPTENATAETKPKSSRRQVPAAEATPKTPKPKKVTMTQAELDALLVAAAQRGAETALASVPTGKPKKEDKKAAAKARKDKLKAERKAANANLKEELAKQAGVTVEQVTEAFAIAHKFAAEDQTNYKARYDEKLIEVIGVPKFNRSTSKAA